LAWRCGTAGITTAQVPGSRPYRCCIGAGWTPSAAGVLRRCVQAVRAARDASAAALAGAGRSGERAASAKVCDTRAAESPACRCCASSFLGTHGDRFTERKSAHAEWVGPLADLPGDQTEARLRTAGIARPRRTLSWLSTSTPTSVAERAATPLRSTLSLNRSLERLSSGLRINAASTTPPDWRSPIGCAPTCASPRRRSAMQRRHQRDQHRREGDRQDRRDPDPVERARVASRQRPGGRFAAQRHPGGVHGAGVRDRSHLQHQPRSTA